MIGVDGKNVVVTGTVPGESRVTAQAKLRAAGAFVHDTVNGKIDLLITGAKVGPAKMAKAASLGVQVVPWEQVAWNGGGEDDDAAERFAAHCEGYMTQRATPRQIAPMLAVKQDAIPTGPEWSYEIKWDGVRCIATVKDGAVAMQSRTGKTDYVAEYPRVAAELATLPDCVLDGELIAGGQDASGLRAQFSGFVVFDCIERGGTDLRAQPLAERRRSLGAVLAAAEVQHVAASPVFDAGDDLLGYCVEHGLEGVVAKQDTSRYLDGERSKSWVKVKVRPEQEFVVLGYTLGEGRRADTFGALLLGVYDDDDRLTYCGKVGTGWDDAEHARLAGKLAFLRYNEGDDRPGIVWPKKLPKAETAGASWVVPELVVQCAFQRWTEDNRLWHPSYKGERLDKPAADVRREA